MIYSMFLFGSKTGLLSYEKTFQDFTDGKINLMSAFLSALKTFISEIIKDGKSELNAIKMSDYILYTQSISEINNDLVIIYDQDDQKHIKKFVPKIIKILLNYKSLFDPDDFYVTDFSILDMPLIKILKTKKLLPSAQLNDHREAILQDLWEYQCTLPPEKCEKLRFKINLLSEKLEDENQLKEKLKLLIKILEKSKALKDYKIFIKFKGLETKLLKEIEDKRLKLNYFYNQTRKALNRSIQKLGPNPIKKGKYNDVYLNLYSFCTKLKYLTDHQTYNYCLNAARKIAEETTSNKELSNIFKYIYKIEDYLKNF